VTEDNLSTATGGPGRRIAIYAGTFDPVQNGHVDIAQRASRLFDELIVAVYDRPAKSLLFSPEERIDLVRRSLGQVDDGCRLVVEGFSGLLVHYAHSRGATAIVRGLRAVTDFEAEYQMTMMNRQLQPDLETVFLMTSLPFAYLSSSLVKEVAALGADIEGLVPPPVAEALLRRFGRE
jgi:pantetheine-phosphate adenylyltransferase